MLEVLQKLCWNETVFCEYRRVAKESEVLIDRILKTTETTNPNYTLNSGYVYLIINKKSQPKLAFFLNCDPIEL